MNLFHCYIHYERTTLHEQKIWWGGREKAEGKNDNNDNTAPNGMKSESGKKLWVYIVFISLEVNLE